MRRARAPLPRRPPPAHLQARELRSPPRRARPRTEAGLPRRNPNSKKNEVCNVAMEECLEREARGQEEAPSPERRGVRLKEASPRGHAGHRGRRASRQRSAERRLQEDGEESSGADSSGQEEGRSPTPEADRDRSASSPVRKKKKKRRAEEESKRAAPGGKRRQRQGRGSSATSSEGQGDRTPVQCPSRSRSARSPERKRKSKKEGRERKSPSERPQEPATARKGASRSAVDAPRPKWGAAAGRRAKKKEAEESENDEWSPTMERQKEQSREQGIKELVKGLSQKGKKELLEGLDLSKAPPRKEAQELTSQQRSILRRAMGDKKIASKLLGMLVEDEEKSKKEAEEAARLKALLAQRERIEEEVRGLQEARKGAQAQGPTKEKKEKKERKSRDGGSQKDR